MTDRYSNFIVILDHNMRSDDAEETLNAIKQIKGVLEVRPEVADTTLAVAISRVDHAWRNAIHEFLKKGVV